MTRRVSAGLGAAVVALFLLGHERGYGQPAEKGKPQSGTPDRDRLAAEVRRLREDLARTEREVARIRKSAPSVSDGASLDVKRFGAKGDGKTDDTAALQAALDAAGNDSPWGVRGTRILVPPGEYLVSSTLKVRRMAFEMLGCGVGNSPAYPAAPGMASVFRWNGPPDAPMMRIRDSYGIAIRRIRWEGKEGVAGTSAIELKWLAEDQQGTNGGTVVEECHFGRYAHTGQGIHKGDLAYGILMDGDNGNNDEFRIARCLFTNCAKAGVRLANTQSVWGSVNDCTLSQCGAGIDTAAHLTGYNVCFDHCERDWEVRSTAQVRVFGWQSEGSRRLAALGPYAGLFADGGYLQLGAIAGGVMIDAFPSDTTQVALRNLSFTQNDLSPRPKIRFGPSQKDVVVGKDFRIGVVDCTGLYPDQFDLAGRLWAEVPESRGEVEFRGVADRAYGFRNSLRMSPLSARTLDPSRLDLAASTDPPATVNSPGPLGVQGNEAKLHAGSGTPEGAVAAPVGSLYLRTDGGPGAALYVKETGAGKTGWAAK